MKMLAAAPDMAPPENAAEVPSAGWALTGLSLSVLLSSLGTSVANVALPTLAHAFGATFQEVQWVVLAYLLAVTSLIVGVGRLGDMLGRRRLLLTGISLFTTGSILCGFASTLSLLIAARALQGVGAAAMMALTMAFVSEIVPKSETGRAMGLLGTMSAVGTALGPSLGGVLIAAAGWRAIFLLNLPLGFAALLLARRHLRKDRPGSRRDRPGFDGLGTLLLALALAVYALAMTTGRGNFGRFNLALLSGAAGLLGLFLFAESRAGAPLIRLGLLRDGALRAGLLTSGLVSTVMMATLVVGPFYLSLGLGLESTAIGLILSMGPLGAALAGTPAGRLTDRYGASRVTTLGLLGIASGSLSLALLPAPLGILGYVAQLVTITVGYALFQTANNTGVMREVPAGDRGVISGLLNLARNLGLVTGASVMGAVFASASRTTDIAMARPVAVAIGMRVTFAVAAILILAALAIATTSHARAPQPSSQAQPPT